jgi:DNA-binding NarL/FixJ family response regulator
MLSPDLDEEELFEFIKNSAAGCIGQNANSDDLVRIIKRVVRGEYPIDDYVITRPGVTQRVLKHFEDMASNGDGLKHVFKPLTAREKQILNYIAEGNKNKRIANMLGIKEQTIKCYVSAILRKLNANHRAHAVSLAIRSGLIPAADVSITSLINPS